MDIIHVLWPTQGHSDLMQHHQICWWCHHLQFVNITLGKSSFVCLPEDFIASCSSIVIQEILDICVLFTWICACWIMKWPNIVFSISVFDKSIIIALLSTLVLVKFRVLKCIGSHSPFMQSNNRFKTNVLTKTMARHVLTCIVIYDA